MPLALSWRFRKLGLLRVVSMMSMLRAFLGSLSARLIRLQHFLLGLGLRNHEGIVCAWDTSLVVYQKIFSDGSLLL